MLEALNAGEDITIGLGPKRSITLGTMSSSAIKLRALEEKYEADRAKLIMPATSIENQIID